MIQMIFGAKMFIRTIYEVFFVAKHMIYYILVIKTQKFGIIKELAMIQKKFTLIELLVSTVISSWHFFTNKSTYKTKQRSSRFFERERGRGGKRKLFFQGKKVSFVPRTHPFHFD